jgi:flagellar hook assembly protein FlgD
VTWRVDVDDADGNRVARLDARGEELAVAWDGLDRGQAVPDGRYAATVTAVDPWGNPPATTSIPLVVDTVRPELGQVEAQGAAAAVFSPNGDGVRDSLRLAFTSSEAGTVAATVKDASGTTVATFSSAMAAGPGTTTWDGRTDAGSYVPDGTYAIALRPVDRAGNRGDALSTTVVAYGALGFVATSVKAFFARDLDRYAKNTRLSFRLRAPATVTWQLLDAAGVPVVTRFDARDLAAGSYAWTWDGRLPGGAWAPSGAYRSRVVATDGTTTATQSATVVVGAFRVYLSDATPARGQLITAKIVSTERLRSNPRLTFTQPGRDPVTVRTTRTSTYGYRATFRLSTRGSVGRLVIGVAGTDVGGGRNRSRLAFTMQ